MYLLEGGFIPCDYSSKGEAVFYSISILKEFAYLPELEPNGQLSFTRYIASDSYTLMLSKIDSKYLAQLMFYSENLTMR